jgi:hypothetical protein
VGLQQQNRLNLILIIVLLSGCSPTVLPTTPTFEPTSTATLMPTATVTPTPEPAYDLCSNIEDFRDCYVPKEELLDSDYWNWLNEVVAPTLLSEFKAREDQITDDVIPTAVGFSDGGALFYPHMIGKNEKEIAFWNREVTFGYTEIIDPITNQTLEYLILPVFFYDKETQQIFPVITVVPLFHPEKIEDMFDHYWNEMDGPMILFTTSHGNVVQENITMDDTTDPLVNEAYKGLSQEKVFKMIEGFFEGDLSALSIPGMVFHGAIASGLSK